MADSLAFLREQNVQDITALLRDLRTRLNKLEVMTGRYAYGWKNVSPSMAASAVPTQNTFLVPYTIYVSGGTVSNISIQGLFSDGTPALINTGLTSGTFRLNRGDYIVITYSSAPTWHWYGD